MPETNKKKPGPEVEESRSSSISNINSALVSPTLKGKSSIKLRKKSKPHLRRLPSGPNKLVFSVDDDINDEIDPEDQLMLANRSSKNKVDREYLEGYNDALKALYLKKSKKEMPQDESYFPEVGKPEEQEWDNNIMKYLSLAEDNLKVVENIDGDITPSNVVSTPLIEEDEELEGSNNDESDHDSTLSTSSSETMESLNLRERQDAINSTHPFGIKLWKPSLYKKKRSVATRAEEDIHDFTKRRPTGLFWGVYLTNFMWTITFGMFLYIVCMFSSILLLIISGFGVKRNLRHYARLLYNLGKYWFYPFGKFVILNKDDNYLDEDDIYGSSIGEFHRWRREEEGRLFFAPPRRNTNSNGESRPLIKDHKGRALRDSYTFLNDENQGPSNTAIGDDIEDEDPSRNDIKVRFFGRGNWTWSRIIFYVLFYGFLQPIFYVVGGLCWLMVFTIPMTNVTAMLCSHLKRHPLALHFEDEKAYYAAQTNEAEHRKRKNQSILLCTYRCSGWHYYKYTIDGTNVFIINLLLAVFFVIFDFYVLKERIQWDSIITDSTFLFCACLFSTIPLAFFIGQAVASISAQSSMGVGAFINAFFSTIVEIFLYCVALSQEKAKIVEGAMIGSILAGVLLLPGLSMCAGAFKRKTQRYNPRSAGVSSTMLLFGMLTMFAPSLFYQIYGSYEIRCKQCEITDVSSHDFGDDCNKCRFIQPSFALDKLYYSIIQPFSLTVAGALLLAYVCGLFFTLRTHASLIWASTEHHAGPQNKKDDGASLRSPSLASIDFKKPRQTHSISALPISNNTGAESALKRQPTSLTSTALPSPSLEVTKQRNPKVPIHKKQSALDTLTPVRSGVKDSIVEETEEVGGHDAPNWSRSKSTFILLSATLLYAVIAEILVDVVDDVLKAYPINPKLLGLTVFALVPNTTEFLNAISFALGGNVALSMEIGSAYALQVVLIQIPVLTLHSIYQGYDIPAKIFSLVFPKWDIIATLISIYLFTYIYAEGKSNYFKGFILMLIYAVVLVGFYLNDIIESLDDGYERSPIAPPPQL